MPSDLRNRGFRIEGLWALALTTIDSAMILILVDYPGDSGAFLCAR
jgi:hypothetical protein